MSKGGSAGRAVPPAVGLEHKADSDDLFNTPFRVLKQSRDRRSTGRGRATCLDWRKAVDAFLGDLPLNRPAETAGSERQCPAIVFENSSDRSLAAKLRRRGFKFVQEFALLPSDQATRWLTPLGNVASAISGLQIYSPHRRRGWLFKQSLLAAMRIGWQGWARHRVLVATKDALPLERLTRKVLGESQVVFSLSLGTPGRFRKLGVQVMRPDGEILGYLKLPLTEAASQRIRHEGAMVARLSEFPELRPHLPALLYQGEWMGGRILLQSPIVGDRGPVAFGAIHEKFLRALRAARPTERPAQAIVDSVAARWRETEQLVDSDLRSLGRRTLEGASGELAGMMIPCGIMHGDFAPWNTRVKKATLYVFDWESSAWEAPVSWDFFHFHVQLASFLNRKLPQSFLFRGAPNERASFSLYLLYSLSQLLEEGASDSHLGVECRRRLLHRVTGTTGTLRKG